MDCLTKNLEFEHNGVRFLQVGMNLATDMVNVKNLSTGTYKEIDYNKLQKLLKK
jgi:hypothetical protein